MLTIMHDEAGAAEAAAGASTHSVARANAIAAEPAAADDAAAEPAGRDPSGDQDPGPDQRRHGQEALQHEKEGLAGPLRRPDQAGKQSRKGDRRPAPRRRGRAPAKLQNPLHRLSPSGAYLFLDRAAVSHLPCFLKNE